MLWLFGTAVVIVGALLAIQPLLNAKIALAAGHPSGWRLPAWSAGAAAAWFSIVCWLEPHLVASVSRPWAAATLLWSVAFIAATHVGARDRASGWPSMSGVTGNESA